MRVALGGRHAGVAEQLLDRADVGSSLQQMGGERMSQGVRRHASTGQRGASVSSHKPDVAWGDRATPEVRSSAVSPAPARAGAGPPRARRRSPRGRHSSSDLALLRPLPHHGNAPAVQVRRRQGQAGDLCDAQPRPVQQLQDRPVAERDGAGRRAAPSSASAATPTSGASTSAAASAGRSTTGSLDVTFGGRAGPRDRARSRLALGPSDRRCGSPRPSSRSTRERTRGS